MKQMSNTLIGHIAAYNIFSTYASSDKEYKEQLHAFALYIDPYVAELSPLLEQHSTSFSPHPLQLCALLSIATDIGLDLFFLSDLPYLLTHKTNKTLVKEVFQSLPSFNHTLRHELKCQLSRYGIAEKPRREVEYDLFNGIILFSSGRHLSSNNTIQWGPYVLHPFYRLMMQRL